jgi:hypothetical protein
MKDWVAGVRLAQQAMLNTQLEAALTAADDDEREARVSRKRAIRHVLESGTQYTPIATQHREGESHA